MMDDDKLVNSLSLLYAREEPSLQSRVFLQGGGSSAGSSGSRLAPVLGPPSASCSWSSRVGIAELEEDAGGSIVPSLSADIVPRPGCLHVGSRLVLVCRVVLSS